ncbi:hypothetical protein B0H11DRAFT_1734991 [Mycena galericulata]|nr:hypothetical protein B0H11DRAFT_1734991 [Mycena galericulata]
MATTNPTLPVALTIFGIFSVRNGNRVSTVKRTGGSVFHQQYMTAIECENGQRLRAQLRVYSPPGDQTLPDNTVVLTVGQIIFPAGGADALMDAIRVVPFPGDPTSDAYQDNMPDFPVPSIIGLGHVLSPHHTLQDGKSRAWPVTVGAYVQDTNQTCTIECVYDGSSKRWASTNVPARGTCIQFGGHCREISTTGIMRLNLDYIVLNVAPRGNVTENSARVSGGDPTN